jgi:MFS family permease
VFTVANGFAQDYVSLFIARALQGFGFGGEWAVGSVLMGEVVRSGDRGKAVGTVESGWAIGWGVASILYSVAFTVLPEALAWRALFWVGIAPALLVFYTRRFVPEPELFKESRRAGKESTLLAIFASELIKTTALAALLTTGAQGGYSRSRRGCRHSCAPCAISRCSTPAASCSASSRGRRAKSSRSERR